MGPIEILFLTIAGLFGAIGVVRGYARELGITTLLLVGLWVLTFTEEKFPDQLRSLLLLLTGGDPARYLVVKALVFCTFLILLTFVSYQGVTLVFPGKGKNSLLSLGVGLLNGYLFSGTLWHYLAEASWPFVDVAEPFSGFYQLAVQLLPPAILSWEYFIVVAVLMLILRVLK